MAKELALNIILNRNGDPHDVKEACKLLCPIADSEGLSPEDIHAILEIVCSEKLRVGIVSDIFRILIPETKVSEQSISKLLSWLFTNELPHTVERHCLRWLSALLHYNLCERDPFQPYFHSFLATLWEKSHLGSTVLPIVYNLTAPEDCKPRFVRMLLEHRQKNTSLPWDALLSLIKLYRPETVPFRVRSVQLKMEFRDFDVGMLKAQERYQRSTAFEASTIDFEWKTFGYQQVKAHLIPAVELMRRRSGVAALRPMKSLTEFKNLNSMAKNYTKLSVPKQALSLLTNQGGFFFLAFSDVDLQTRFLLNLETTLKSVFLTDPDDYSEEEKLLLLLSVMDLQRSLQQSINVINRFLVQYLFIWDGKSFKDQIMQLLRWFIFENLQEWEAASTVLRIHFRCGSFNDRCIIIRALSGLVFNLSMRSKLACFSPLMQSIDDSVNDKDILHAVGDFVDSLSLEILPHEEASSRRMLLSEVLDFYHELNTTEDMSDVQATVIVPASVVYPCLCSNSRFLIDRLCSLFMKYSTTTRDRLHMHGVYCDFEHLFEHNLGVYFADCYRALFSNLSVQDPNLNTGIFSGEIMEQLEGCRKIGKNNIGECLGVNISPAWWTVEDSGCISSVNRKKLEKLYPGVWALKQFVERHLVTVSN